MSASTAFNIALFGLGAAVGAGATAAVAFGGTKKAPEHVPPRPTPPAPVITIDAKNKPQMSSDLTIGQFGAAVLKYGHPGKVGLRSELLAALLIPDSNAVGPVPDFLIRKAYATAYDRRMRHPAWVSAADAFRL